MDNNIYTTQKDDWQGAVGRLLVAAGLADKLQHTPTILIKPNLVEALPPPITTPVALVEAIVDFIISQKTACRIIVGEGTGAIEYDTYHCFETLGYVAMAARKGVELTDLNSEPLRRHEQPQCHRWPELYLPCMLDEVFLLSVPVLKAHSLAGVTLTMKNMMGCVPPSRYREGNSWGKSAFHSRIHEAVFDLNRYRTPDFTLLDASVGMAEAHLWGRHCDPPVGRLAAGWDPVAIDSYGATLLGKKWQTIGHIKMADRVLGTSGPLTVVDC